MLNMLILVNTAPPPDDQPTITDWISAVGTVLAIVAAIWVGYRQMKKSRELAEEVAQPYVVAYLERNKIVPQVLELVIKNIGSTSARDVRFHVNPELLAHLKDADPEPEPLGIPKTIDTLVPGQEWRTVWIDAADDEERELFKRHEGEVKFRDSKERELKPTPVVLDVGDFNTRTNVDERTTHNVAQELEKLNKNLTILLNRNS